jgi:hypothetical protein
MAQAGRALELVINLFEHSQCFIKLEAAKLIRHISPVRTSLVALIAYIIVNSHPQYYNSKPRSIIRGRPMMLLQQAAFERI